MKQSLEHRRVGALYSLHQQLPPPDKWNNMPVVGALRPPRNPPPLPAAKGPPQQMGEMCISIQPS